VRYTPAARRVANFTVATNEAGPTRRARKQERTEVAHRVVVLVARPAENCGEYLSKGRQVFVEGRPADPRVDKQGRRQAVHDRDRRQPGRPAGPVFLAGGDRGAGPSGLPPAGATHPVRTRMGSGPSSGFDEPASGAPKAAEDDHPVLGPGGPARPSPPPARGKSARRVSSSPAFCRRSPVSGGQSQQSIFNRL